MPSIQQLIEHYGLKPHPEGGYFLESYRAAGKIAALDRNFSTAIYYLLPKGAKSRLHRIASDEVWHFYLGGSRTLFVIHPDGTLETVILGRNILAGERLQHVVAAGCWFGLGPETAGEYSFVGCTVAPGFDFADFEIGTRAALLADFPARRSVIELLTS